MAVSPTLKKVAREANVSVSTVSLVINGRANKNRITAETIDRVKAAASKLNYRPLGSARALSQGKIGCIGLFLPEMSTTLSFEIYMSMFTEMNTQFHKHDLNMMVFAIDDKSPVIPKMIRERHVDGVIVLQRAPLYLLEELRVLGIPTVYLNADVPGQTDVIMPDDYQGISLAVQHLVDLGHKRILYLNKHALLYHPSMSIRLRAFYESMYSFGLNPYPGSDALLWQKIEGNKQPPNAEDFKVFVSKILSRPVESRPTAIIAHTALWLRGLMLTIQAAGLQVPRDISVVCCDQLQIVREWIPSITHLRIPSEDIAKSAVKLLLEKIDDKSKRQPLILLPEELIVAESTAPPFQLNSI